MGKYFPIMSFGAGVFLSFITVTLYHLQSEVNNLRLEAEAKAILINNLDAQLIFERSILEAAQVVNSVANVSPDYSK